MTYAKGVREYGACFYIENVGKMGKSQEKRTTKTLF